MTEPLGPIIITAREVYDAVVRLTGRVDVLINQQGETQQDVKDIRERDLSDHETRIRAVERRQWKLPSIATVLGSVSLIANIVSYLHR